MTRSKTLLAVLLLAGGSAAALAQAGSGAGPSATAPRPMSPPAATSGRSTTTIAPSAVDNPNNNVPPSAAGLPGGGGNVPVSSSGDAGREVPIYGTQDNSGMARPLDESAQRSSGTACDGTGTQQSSGSGSSSTVLTGCAPSAEALGTQPIMTPESQGTSGAVNTDPATREPPSASQ